MSRSPSASRRTCVDLPQPSTPSSASNRPSPEPSAPILQARLASQIDHHVRHRLGQLSAPALDHARLQPARALWWVGRDHDFVGRELLERVLDRLVWIVVVAEASGNVKSALAHDLERRLQALLRLGDELVDVGRPVLGGRPGKWRADHEYLALGLTFEPLFELLAK